MNLPPVSTAALHRGFWGFYTRHRVSINDLGVLAAFLCVLTYVGYAFDIFVTEGRASSAEQSIELDEALSLGVALAVGLLIFAGRRYIEQTKEMRRRQDAERHVRELAFQDPLTGLANRRRFENALRIAAASPPSSSSSHAVLMLDLNGFKRINDSYGHGIGDEALIIVSQRLLNAARSQDLVARLGGDEFVVLAHHLSGPESASAIALRIIEALAAPIVINAVEHTVGTGIGISLLTNGADTPAEAVRKADVALYRAKAEHRSAIRFYETIMDDRVRERDEHERALLAAIEGDLIVPLFRPTISLESGTVVGFEVLPSWIGATIGASEPDRLMAIAEETGVIHTIGLRLLDKACAAASRWPRTVRLSIDILPGHLRDPNLSSAIFEILNRHSFAPERLEIEVAENIIVADLEGAKSAIAPLRAAGVKVTLDKFGTGYSNLYHMLEFAFDKVKIDRRFTDRLGEEDADRVIRALAGLGHGLGLVVSVDGQSNLANREALLRSGVEQGQGSGVLVSSDQAIALFQ